MKALKDSDLTFDFIKANMGTFYDEELAPIFTKCLNEIIRKESELDHNNPFLKKLDYGWNHPFVTYLDTRRMLCGEFTGYHNKNTGDRTHNVTCIKIPVATKIAGGLSHVESTMKHEILHWLLFVSDLPHEDSSTEFIYRAGVHGITLHGSISRAEIKMAHAVSKTVIASKKY